MMYYLLVGIHRAPTKLHHVLGDVAKESSTRPHDHDARVEQPAIGIESRLAMHGCRKNRASSIVDLGLALLLQCREEVVEIAGHHRVDVNEQHLLIHCHVKDVELASRFPLSPSSDSCVCERMCLVRLHERIRDEGYLVHAPTSLLECMHASEAHGASDDGDPIECRCLAAADCIDRCRKNTSRQH